MLVHVDGGGEESVADVAPVRSYSLIVGLSSAPLHHDSMNSLQVDIEVPSLRVAPATDVAVVRSLLSVSSHVTLQERRYCKIFATSWALMCEQ